MARWVCQPAAYEENKGCVAQLCSMEKMKGNPLLDACCDLVGQSDSEVADVQSDTEVADVQSDSEVADVQSDSDVADDLPDLEVTDVQSDSKVADPKVADLFKDVNIMPDLDKKLLKSFFAPMPKKVKGKKTQIDKLSLSMQCVSECEQSCQMDGGECQAIQSAEDCQQTISELQQNGFDINGNDPAHVLATTRTNKARGCHVRHISRRAEWNPPVPGEPLKLNNVCGCYQ